MTTIPNLNIVIQQANSVMEAKNALHPSLDKAHLSSAYQVEKEEKQRTNIQETEKKEKMNFGKRNTDQGNSNDKTNKNSEKINSFNTIAIVGKLL